MNLEVYLTALRPTIVFSCNITHNLNKMAEAVGIYTHIWRPEELDITKAHELIEPLQAGLEQLYANPMHFRQFNARNGWGVYKHLVKFIENYLANCREFPDADVKVNR